MKNAHAWKWLLTGLMACFLEGNSLATPPDSVGSKVIEGKVYILHRIMHKETLWSICQRYGTTVEVVSKLNPEKTPAIQHGDTLLIPTRRNIQGFTPLDTLAPVFHTVQPGETLYRIGQQYSVSVSDLMKVNQLESIRVKSGTKLIIRFQPGPGQQYYHVIRPGENRTYLSLIYNVPHFCLLDQAGNAVDSVLKPGDTLTVDFGCKERLDTMRYHRKTTPTGRPESYREEGLAELIDSGVTQGWALHQPKTVGQFLTVVNPATMRKLRVKVIGILPPTDKDKGIIIKLSKYACQRLGMTQKLNKVYLMYGDEEPAQDSTEQQPPRKLSPAARGED